MKLKQALNNGVKTLIGLTNPKTAITLRYLHMFHTWPQLDTPVTFSEKINAYKLQLSDRYARLADKVAVKDYVAKKIGAEHVIPTLYAGETLPPREERTWPLPYVIKMNHGSGWNILVRTEAERNWYEIEKKIAKWSKLTFGRDTGEVHYAQIKPMVLVEEFISTEPGVLPKDYKIFVFNGKTEFIEVITDREHNHAACFYNTNWQKLHFSLSDSKPYAGEIKKPDTMDTMIILAETLAADFPFVRVDFYDINGHIYLGEMTFTPSAGFAKFTPSAYDIHFGKKLVLG
jgi:hypothetical protein